MNQTFRFSFYLAPCIAAALLLPACTGQSARGVIAPAASDRGEVISVADTLTRARTADGQYISWVEHRIDDQGVNGGVALRGGDGLKVADLDRDGYDDIVSVHEDSNHLRIAYGSARPHHWTLRTVASGAAVGAIEDVAVGDLNGDGYPDLVAACEEAHLAYFENPGDRQSRWPQRIPSITRDRGSWLKVAIADLNNDGKPEVIGANKGFADVVRPGAATAVRNPTASFALEGAPLTDSAWQEQVLLRDGIPNHVLAADLDNDGDLDLVAASRLGYRITVLENRGTDAAGALEFKPQPVAIEAGQAAKPGWRGASNGFNAQLADLNRDGRLDLVVNLLEFDTEAGTRWQRAGLGWLAQPADRDAPWQFHRIGQTLPDWVIGIGVADLDGDGDLDAISGGYSGLNVIDGGYSGAARETESAAVTADASVARLAWYENSGDPAAPWQRHDISRRVRGMYDEFAFRDLDQDGDLDIIATRGNAGSLDGVFWLEQRRSAAPLPAFKAAREAGSRALPLPATDWRERYGRELEYIAPNKRRDKS